MQSKHFLGRLLLTSFLFCASCAPIQPVEPSKTVLPTNLPPLPFDHPNLLGEVTERPEPPPGPIPTLTRQSALTCLATGRSVYGIALANTNVRTKPEVDSCRIGRAPRGTLLRIDGIYEQGELERLTSLVRVTATSSPSAENIGFEEDILPIFQRNCNACHGLAAKSAGLVAVEYDLLLTGSNRGEVVVPGDLEGSMLWWQIFTDRMPVIGELSDDDKELIKTWIEAGAPEKRPETRTEITNVWLELNEGDFDDVPHACEYNADLPHSLVSADLIQLLSCGVEPNDSMLVKIRSELAPVAAPKVAAASAAVGSSSGASQPSSFSGGASGITVAPLGLGPPLDSDEFMVPKPNFCMEPRYMKLQEEKSITALAFAPDGRLFMALDSMPTGQNVDSLVLLDAHHPSRSVAVVDSNTGGGFAEILTEKGRITGLDYHNGSLYVSLAGEVGVIPDGQEYKKLAGGFAVASQYFHANNGIVVSDGWLYVSAGGIRDGWSDGPIVGMEESGAMQVVSGGNRLAARIVRAPLNVLLDQRSIDDFETVARGVRNPYGLAAGPDGRLWFTDNGATNVPDEVSAGDEVNVLNPRSVTPGTPDGNTPFYGFPLSLTSGNPGWYTEPVLAMPNASAPTGITWAYGTIYYAQYGMNPGVYRLASSGGRIVAERIMMGWPIVSLATAPDGSIWMGMGNGGIYRITPC